MHFISKFTKGETCWVCQYPATHKVGEEIFSDDPLPNRHNLTNYVCCSHFTFILGRATGCFKEDEDLNYRLKAGETVRINNADVKYVPLEDDDLP